MASATDFVACSPGDVELIAAVLGSDELTIAAELLDRFGGLTGLADVAIERLAETGGVDVSRAARLHAAFRLGKRLLAAQPAQGTTIASAQDVYRLCIPLLFDEQREVFMALVLDCRNRVRSRLLIATGTLTSVSVPIRDAFRPVLIENAAGVIFVHNHPSGDPEPSDDDRVLTVRLVEAGTLLGIRVLDHVVVARQGFVSILAGTRNHASFTK